MRILIVGAGATGGFYGGKLVRAGRDVTFLLRETRAEQIRMQGLRILGHLGEQTTVHPKVITARQLEAQPTTFDLVIVSTKAYQLEGAMDDIAPAIGPETLILPILNGMRQFAILDERFGAERVLGGSVRVVSDLDDAGRIVQMNPLDQMNYGERSGERTTRILAVDAALRDAGFAANLQPSIVETLWQKWVALASMGAVCILARGSAGQVALVPRGAELARAVVEECAAIAAANGHPPPADLVQRQSHVMAEPGSTLTSSLYRDLMKGAPVEADHIIGDLLDRAQGMHTPLLNAAYVQLKIYEALRRAS